MSTLKPRIKTSAKWTADNSVLRKNEIGFESNTGKYKIGNGLTSWNSLPYIVLPADLTSTKHRRLMNRYNGELQYSNSQTTIISQISATLGNTETRKALITFDCARVYNQINFQSFDILVNGVVVVGKTVLTYSNERHSYCLVAVADLPISAIIQVRFTMSNGTLTIDRPTLCIDTISTLNAL